MEKLELKSQAFLNRIKRVEETIRRLLSPDIKPDNSHKYQLKIVLSLFRILGNKDSIKNLADEGLSFEEIEELQNIVKKELESMSLNNLINKDIRSKIKEELNFLKNTNEPR